MGKPSLLQMSGSFHFIYIVKWKASQTGKPLYSSESLHFLLFSSISMLSCSLEEVDNPSTAKIKQYSNEFKVILYQMDYPKLTCFCQCCMRMVTRFPGIPSKNDTRNPNSFVGSMGASSVFVYGATKSVFSTVQSKREAYSFVHFQ